MNYKHPDAFKLSVLTSGLEEVRGVLAYQLMQKNLLIVATRTNQLLIDTHQKALTELSLVANEQIGVPNPMESVNRFYSKSNKDNINLGMFNNIKSKYNSNLTGNVGGMLYNVYAKKT